MLLSSNPSVTSQANCKLGAKGPTPGRGETGTERLTQKVQLDLRIAKNTQKLLPFNIKEHTTQPCAEVQISFDILSPQPQ